MPMCFCLQGTIKGYPVLGDPNSMDKFLDKSSPVPAACPSIVNAKQLGILLSSAPACCLCFVFCNTFLCDNLF